MPRCNRAIAIEQYWTCARDIRYLVKSEKWTVNRRIDEPLTDCVSNPTGRHHFRTWDLQQTFHHSTWLLVAWAGPPPFRPLVQHWELVFWVQRPSWQLQTLPVVDIREHGRNQRHVFGTVRINEKQATKQHPLWIECRIVGPVCIDVRGRLQLFHPLLPGSWRVGWSRWPFPSRSHCRVIG